MEQENLSSAFSHRSCCISHQFHKSASKTPDKIAVVHASPRGRRTETGQFVATPSPRHPPVYEDDVRFTFSEVLAAVDSLSHRLQLILDGGVDRYLIRPSSPGQLPVDRRMNTPKIVGIYMIPSVEYIVSVLSVMRCGEAFMPLDPSWPKERVLSAISSSRASLVIGISTPFEGTYSHQMDDPHWLVGSGSCPVLTVSMKNNLKESFTSPCLIWPCARCGNKRSRPFCYLMYTSGSTGRPKGVCGTEQGLLNRFSWMQDSYPLRGHETLLFKTSVSFIDHLQEILGSLLTACTIIIPPFNVLKENIFSILDYLQDYSIDRLVAVPSLMRMLLPTLQSLMIRNTLKLLVLSGEILHLSLWKSLTELLPNTKILNLYGSTEVSGDCTYFDCKNLSSILETEELSSVPIGTPIPNCDVVLVGEVAPNHGEIYVSGICVATGYFNHHDRIPLEAVNSLPYSTFCTSGKESVHYFKTGDFARLLPSGDLVFLGRNDRTVKVNGHRIALDEIENTIRAHEDVADAAVVLDREAARLKAYVVTKQGNGRVGSLRPAFRGWILDRLPPAMVPRRFFFVESIPMASTGKVDYALLAGSRSPTSDVCGEIEEVPDSDLLQAIKKAFCDALVVEEVGDDDDFFAMGGDSISAAHASHKLGIDMRLLYSFPSPSKLTTEMSKGSLPRSNISTVSGTKKRHSKLSGDNDTEYHPNKAARTDLDPDGPPWGSVSKHATCAFSRRNKVMFREKHDGNGLFQATWSGGALEHKRVSMKRFWSVHMESCVDASPLVVVRERDVYVYIGSHSHKFVCVHASSGFVRWEVKLEGRIECSAAIVGDFSQVVVGCYEGNVYFLDSSSGSISWTFRTGGEVKSQPVVDTRRHLVWCGSYDHNLYALDYQSYRCACKLHCGGSIYGSPAIDEVDETLYVACTNGCVKALSLKALPFDVLWTQNLGAPIFGSLSIDSVNRIVICCLVNGHIVALDATGSVVWRGITGGPIFAGPCLSRVLHNQVLVCSRDGSVYSFGLDKGNLLWKHNVGDPITSSAYVDENLQSISASDRLICVCSSSGSIILLRIELTRCESEKYAVQESARLDLGGGGGGIFSSPVMIGGRIFVGCRDDYVHCVGIEGQTNIEL